MLKLLASLLRKKLPEGPAPGNFPAGIPHEDEPIYRELAMTDELREAIFPTTPQMISAIFDRALPPLPRPPAAPAQSAPADKSAPILW